MECSHCWPLLKKEREMVKNGDRTCKWRLSLKKELDLEEKSLNLNHVPLVYQTETTTMVMTSSVERADFTYYITLGDKQICSTFAQDHSNIKDWISQIEKRYGNKKGKKNKKQQPLVVGLWAEQSLYYMDRKHNFHVKDDKNNHKTAPYELLVLCVGDQCLLWELYVKNTHWHTPREGYVPDEMPKALKDFLSSSQIIVVGLGIDAMVKKLESDTDLLIPKQLELSDLVQEKMGLTLDEFAKSNLESLAKLLMGPKMEVVKPESMKWREPGYCSYLSDRLAQYGSIHAFLVAEMANKLMTK